MLTDKHLIPIHPVPAAAGTCPRCESERVEVLGSVWPGINVMARCRCGACGLFFYRDLPYGFAIDHPMTIGEDGTLFHGERLPEWIREPFMKGFNGPNEAAVDIERRVYREADRVVVLNTLDFLYGHVLLKLYNALHYLDQHPDLGLIVVVPRMYEWLIPEGCAEAWIVDLRLGGIQGWHKAIDAFVQERLPTYAEVHLAKGYSHPDMTGADISRFTRVKAFDTEQFNAVPPHITFVTREDRLWFRSPLRKFLFRGFNKVGLRGLARWVGVKGQDRLVQRAMARIRQVLPQASFSIVGLGSPGLGAPGVEDLRTRRMNVDTELDWCRAYGASQVVIGVHGSNMLLPTALAAACVEILPEQRYENIVQDVTVRYSGRAQLFHYRFVSEFITPAGMARLVRSLFRDRPVFMRNNHQNVF